MGKTSKHKTSKIVKHSVLGPGCWSQEVSIRGTMEEVSEEGGGLYMEDDFKLDVLWYRVRLNFLEDGSNAVMSAGVGEQQFLDVLEFKLSRCAI